VEETKFPLAGLSFLGNPFSAGSFWGWSLRSEERPRRDWGYEHALSRCMHLDSQTSLIGSMFPARALTREQDGSSLGHFRFSFLVTLNLLFQIYMRRYKHTCTVHMLEGLAVWT